MKKNTILLLAGVSSLGFAQEISPTSLPGEMASVSNSFGFDIVAILLGVLFYIALPLILYCISSYSLSLLNKHYNKKLTSGVSWVPFVRYYDFVKQATKSSRKAFIVTILPWVTTVAGIIFGILIGIIEKNLDITARGWTSPAFIISGILAAAGFIGIIVMNFWRAFIISRYVQGDTTTAFGLSTYTALVLWYIALDRVKKNTNIIGMLGFVGLGLIVCFYIGIFLVLGLSGLETLVVGN